MNCTQCDEEVNCTEEVIRGVLARGRVDQGIQFDLLGDQNPNMSLEEVFKVVE